MDSHYEIRSSILVSCTDPSPVLVIPEGVRAIAMFAIRSSPEEIILPEGLVSLYYAAFQSCQVRAISLPSTLEDIDEFAFANCSRLETIRIPSGVRVIGECAFAGCSSLRHVELPEGLEEIGDEAFESCSSLRELRFPSTLKRIGAEAFSQSCLENVVLPESVTALPRGSFKGVYPQSITAPGLTEAGSLHPRFCTWTGHLRLPRLSIRDVPPRLKPFAMGGFADLDAQGAEMDPEIRKHYLSYLRSRRRALADLAVQDPALLALMLREKVVPLPLAEYMMDQAAKDGQNEAVAMLLQYRNEVFGEPEPEKKTKAMLRSLEQGSMPLEEFRLHWSTVKPKDGELTLRKYLGRETDLILPAYRGKQPIRRLADRIFFQNRDLVSVCIPEGIRHIGNQAFRDCENLRKVELPDSLESIGEHAFCGCTALEEITLPEGLKSLGRACFQYCRSLRRIRLPASLQELPEAAFEGCKALREVSFSEGLLSISRRAFCSCTSLTAADLPRGLTVLKTEAFNGCRGLQQVSLPDSLTVIGEHAFVNCAALREIRLPAFLQTLGDFAFGNCFSLERVEQSPLEPAPPVRTWGYGIFQNCIRLRHLRLPAQLQVPDDMICYGCTSLEDWDVDPASPWLAVDGPWLTTRDGTELVAGLPGLRGTAVLPKGIRVVRPRALYGCPGIAEVVIPESVKEIREFAFTGCHHLTKVRFLGTPDTVTEGAFLDSPVGEHLVLPEGTRIVPLPDPD